MMNVWLQFGTVLCFPHYVPILLSSRTEATFSSQPVNINSLYVLMLRVEGLKALMQVPSMVTVCSNSCRHSQWVCNAL